MIVAYLLMFIIPFALIILTKRITCTIPSFRKNVFLTCLLMLVVIGLDMFIAIRFEEIGLYNQKSTTVEGLLAKAFFAAGFLEEILKATSVVIIVLYLRYKGTGITSKRIILISVMVGCMFAFWEGLMYVFVMGWNVFLRIFTLFCHYSYAVIMGYGLSLYIDYRKQGKKKTLPFLWIIVLPITAHTMMDWFLLAMHYVPNPHHVYFYCSVLTIILISTITYKLLRYIRKDLS